MIDERELYSLGEDGHGPATAHRPVASVLARGARLRRRRQVLRTVGTSTVAVGMLGSGLFLLEQRGGEPEVETADPTTTTSEQPSAPPPPAIGCEGEFVAGTQLDRAEVPDDMRLLPAFVPGDPAITYAAGLRFPDACPGDVGAPTDSALELKAPGDPDTWIWLEGPLAAPVGDSMGVARWPTQVRGVDAQRVQPAGSEADTAFAWTEPDGWSWWINGVNVDEPTLRALTEALVLDSSPEGDEPVATLPSEAIPTGFEITWQTLGEPARFEDGSTQWTVSFGSTGDGGMRCELQVGEDISQAPMASRGGARTQPATVNGQDALWHPVGGRGPLGVGSLVWKPSSGVLAIMGCVDQATGPTASVDVATMIQVAESFTPIPPDDPRLPPG